MNVGRLSRVVRRLYRDGRLPETTSRLLRDLVRLRFSRLGRSLFSALIRPLNLGDGEAVLLVEHWRKWRSNGFPPMSAHDLALDATDLVVTSMKETGVRVFVTAKTPHSFTLGVAVSDRTRALHALRGSLGNGWGIEWRRGNRVRVRALSSRRRARSLLRAENWRVFKLFRLDAHSAIGHEEGPLISFWDEVGDRYELVGQRGLHRYDTDASDTTEEVDGHHFPGLAPFPIGTSFDSHPFPIDVVYTWVDGGDPTWKSSYDLERAARGLQTDHEIHAGRYTSRDELRFSLRSLWLNAGWIRRVFVVTADQRPEWLSEDERLSIVSHKDILPAKALPTFNSHAIESAIHRIPDLAEHFIYLNDDMFLGRPVSPDSFFTPNGLIRFALSEARIPAGPATSHDIAADSGAKNGRDLLTPAFGRSPSHKLQHAPYSMTRGIAEELVERFPEETKRTTYSRFRAPSDLSVASGLVQFYAFCTGRAVESRLQVMYQNIENHNLRLTLRRLTMGRDFDAFCLNETEQSPMTDDMNRVVSDFLESYFPVPSPWES